MFGAAADKAAHNLAPIVNHARPREVLSFAIRKEAAAIARRHHAGRGRHVALRASSLADMIRRADQMGEGWRVPVFQAAFQSLINMSLAQGGARYPAKFFTLAAPTLAILADDVPDAPGPNAWPQTRKILRWASGCILHATGGDEAHSVIAVQMTLALERVAMVEIEQRHHAAWLGLASRKAPRLKVLNILPPRRGRHPIQGAPPER